MCRERILILNHKCGHGSETRKETHSCWKSLQNETQARCSQPKTTFEAKSTHCCRGCIHGCYGNAVRYAELEAEAILCTKFRGFKENAVAPIALRAIKEAESMVKKAREEHRRCLQRKLIYLQLQRVSQRRESPPRYDPRQENLPPYTQNAASDERRIN